MNAPRWIFIAAGSTLLAAGLTISIALVSIYTYLSHPGPIPTPLVGSGLQTGHVYAADGSLLADLHGPINRQSIPLDQVSDPFKHAVLAAEDGGFYAHKALDFRSLIRAGVTDLLAGRWVQGGSSITQQYVKLVYVGSEKTLARKAQEARLAYQIERKLSKDEILNRYLNTAYFGRGAYGVQAAAQAYFNEPASQVNVAQSTLLAALLASPTAYSPDANPGAAEARRQYVVGRMQALGFITAQEADQTRLTTPTLAPPPAPSTIAYRYPWFVDTVRKYLFQKYGEALTLGGGLNVKTTLNPAAQDTADAAVAATLPKSTDPYAALVSIDPKSGYVTAMVGGRAFGAEKFNLATQGRRQPGSAMKPFVLIAALEKGISPQTVYDAPSQICLAGWLPTCEVSTFQNESFGAITLETATIHSVNTVYAELIMQVGPKSVVGVANAMGIPGPGWLLPTVAGCLPAGSPACTAHLDPLPSLALGSEDVSPLEMASAYATLADNGMYRTPKFVAQVTNAQGDVLESGPSAGRQVVDPTIVRTVNRILNEVVTMGTGTAANIGRPEAGKTGTTSDFRNAWFVGYTPEAATAAWVGYRDANLPLLGVEGVPQMAGGTIPAALWARFMKGALPPATPQTLIDDGASLGLNGGYSTLINSGTAASCALLPSTTVVPRLPAPVTGTAYNVYPYLVCDGNGRRAPGPAANVAATQPLGTPPPDSLPAPLPAGQTPAGGPLAGQGPAGGPTTGGNPVAGAQPPARPGCLLGLLC